MKQFSSNDLVPEKRVVTGNELPDRHTLNSQVGNNGLPTNNPGVTQGLPMGPGVTNVNPVIENLPVGQDQRYNTGNLGYTGPTGGTLGTGMPGNVQRIMTACQQCGDSYEQGTNHIHRQVASYTNPNVKVQTIRSEEHVHQNIQPVNEKIIHKHVQPPVHDVKHVKEIGNLHQGTAVNIVPHQQEHIHEAIQPVHEKIVHTHVGAPVQDVKVIQEGPLPAEKVQSHIHTHTTGTTGMTGQSCQTGCTDTSHGHEKKSIGQKIKGIFKGKHHGEGTAGNVDTSSSHLDANRPGYSSTSQS